MQANANMIFGSCSLINTSQPSLNRQHALVIVSCHLNLNQYYKYWLIFGGQVYSRHTPQNWFLVLCRDPTKTNTHCTGFWLKFEKCNITCCPLVPQPANVPGWPFFPEFKGTVRATCDLVLTCWGESWESEIPSPNLFSLLFLNLLSPRGSFWGPCSKMTCPTWTQDFSEMTNSFWHHLQKIACFLNILWRITHTHIHWAFSR